MDRCGLSVGKSEVERYSRNQKVFLIIKIWTKIHYYEQLRVGEEVRIGLGRSHLRAMLKKTLSTIPSKLKNYVNGASAAASSADASFQVPNAACGNSFTEFDISTSEDVDAAVKSAKVGQQEWAQTPPAEKAHVMRRAASILRARCTELADLECLDTGRPRKEMDYDIACAWECLEYMSSICQTTATSGEHILLQGSSPGASFGYTRREPLGVCAGIGAWNCTLSDV